MAGSTQLKWVQRSSREMATAERRDSAGDRISLGASRIPRLSVASSTPLQGELSVDRSLEPLAILSEELHVLVASLNDEQDLGVIEQRIRDHVNNARTRVVATAFTHAVERYKQSHGNTPLPKPKAFLRMWDLRYLQLIEQTIDLLHLECKTSDPCTEQGLQGTSVDRHDEDGR